MNLSELLLPSVDCVLYFFRVYFVVYTSCIRRFTESSLGSLSFQEGLVGFTRFPRFTTGRVQVYQRFTRLTEFIKEFTEFTKRFTEFTKRFTEFTKGFTTVHWGIHQDSLSLPRGSLRFTEGFTRIHWVYWGVHQGSLSLPRVHQGSLRVSPGFTEFTKGFTTVH